MKFIQRASLLFFLCAICASPLLAQSDPISPPTGYVPQPFTVLGYTAVLDLTKAPAKQMSGVCEITIRWDSTPDYFRFHLRGLVVDSAFEVPATVPPFENSKRLTMEDMEDTASATYHHRVKSIIGSLGGTEVIRIFYHGTMTSEAGSPSWGGISSTDSTLFAIGVGLYNNYVSATQHWLPCYDHPSMKAPLDVTFKVLKPNTVASNGTLVDVSDIGDTTLYHWQSMAAATYLFTFATGKYIPLEIANSPVPMVVYAQARDTANARYSFKLLPRMVLTFSSRFVPYPWEKVGYVMTTIGAMEHQTMISYPTSLLSSRDTVNSIAAHELSHQWFGDLVSPLDFRHAWLNESFADFCECLWQEELKGFTGYIASQDKMLGNYLGGTVSNEGKLPLYDFSRARPGGNYPNTIYQKGSVVVGMLRYEMGDSLFFAGIKSYLTKHAHGNATTAQLQSDLEAVAGRSLQWFFDQWVYRAGYPTVQTNINKVPEPGGGGNQVTVTLKQTGGDSLYTDLPVEIGFVVSKGVFYRTMLMTQLEQKFTFDSIPDFTSVTINKGPSLRALMKTTTVTGITASSEGGGISFHVNPNPLNGREPFLVQVSGTSDCRQIQYQVYDTNGRRVLLGAAESCRFTIPSEDIVSGAYVLRFKLSGVEYDFPVRVAR